MDVEYFCGEINDKDLVLKLIKNSTLPLLYMTENKPKDTEFYRRTSIINRMFWKFVMKTFYWMPKNILRF